MYQLSILSHMGDVLRGCGLIARSLSRSVPAPVYLSTIKCGWRSRKQRWDAAPLTSLAAVQWPQPWQLGSRGSSCGRPMTILWKLTPLCGQRKATPGLSSATASQCRVDEGVTENSWGAHSHGKKTDLEWYDFNNIGWKKTTSSDKLPTRPHIYAALSYLW